MICSIVCILQTPVSCFWKDSVPLAIHIDSMSNPEIQFPLQDSLKKHKPCSTAWKSIIWNFMTDALVIFYQDMLMCSWLKDFLTGSKPFLMFLFYLLIDFSNPTRSIWLSETWTHPIDLRPHWSFRHHIELPGSGWSTGGLLAKSTRFDFTKGITFKHRPFSFFLQ